MLKASRLVKERNPKEYMLSLLTGHTLLEQSWSSPNLIVFESSLTFHS